MMSQNDTSHSRPPGPVVLTESASHYLLRIHPDARDRVQKVPFRQWDGFRKSWVFPKNTATFGALVLEFQADADVFAIHPPEAERRTPELVVEPEPSDDNAAQEIEEPREMESGGLKGEMGDLSRTLNSIQDEFGGHDRNLQSLLLMQKEIVDRLNELELSPKAVSKETRVVQVLPDLLDLSKKHDLEVFERALITVAYFATNQDQAFMTWVVQRKPLQLPSDFVQGTHELLKKQLEKITGIHDPNIKFWELTQKAKDDNLIYCEAHDSAQAFYILNTMNSIRNQFAHARKSFGESDRRVRSILYLMNLSLIWARIMVDEETNENA